MNYVILGISMLTCLFGGIIRKYLGDKFEDKYAMYHVYNAFVSVVGAAALLLASKTIKASAFTLLLGIAFGIISALCLISISKAYEKGTFSYTTVIVSFSSIIPAFSGCLFWNETISFVQILGIILMLVCFVCSVDFSKTEWRSSRLWLVYAFIAFICMGFVGVMQKWYQNTAYKNELDGFLIIAFLVSFVYSATCVIVGCIKQPKKLSSVLKGNISTSAVVLMIIAGVCMAANNKMNLYLSGTIDSAMLFPTLNGGGAVLSTIASQIIFKEKLSTQKWIGIVVGIIAVVLLCNPF